MNPASHFLGNATERSLFAVKLLYEKWVFWALLRSIKGKTQIIEFQFYHWPWMEMRHSKLLKALDNYCLFPFRGNLAGLVNHRVRSPCPRKSD